MQEAKVRITNGSRNGKHRADKSLVGFFADNRFRALLALVVRQTGETATQIMADGVRRRATDVGILKNGEIAPKFQRSFAAILKRIKTACSDPLSQKGKSRTKQPQF